MADFAIVEKKNHLHIHGIFHSKERAERFIKDTIPTYCTRGYYVDKTLKPESFEAIEMKSK